MKINNKFKILLGILLIISVVFITTTVFADDPVLDLDDLTGQVNSGNKNNEADDLSSNLTKDNDTIEDLSGNLTKDNTTGNLSSNLTTNNTSTYNEDLAHAGVSDITFGVVAGIAIFAIVGVVAFKKMDDYKNI